jgi:hypothetical protein
LNESRARPAPELNESRARPAPELNESRARPAPELNESRARPAPELNESRARPAPELNESRARPAPELNESRARPAPELNESRARPAPELNESVLRARFGWTKVELNMAIAMVYRTEFPFDGAHPNPFYFRTQPWQRYERCLRVLPEQSRHFVMRFGPVLAQYADQTSWYATQDFANALLAVEGLVEELNAIAGPPTSTQDLNTTGFLYAIGDERRFEIDYKLAEQYSIAGFSLPSHDEAFALLPPWYGQTFRANIAAFDSYDSALASGKLENDAALVGQRTFIRSIQGR